jgi:hypothetical protein
MCTYGGGHTRWGDYSDAATDIAGTGLWGIGNVWDANSFQTNDVQKVTLPLQSPPPNYHYGPFQGYYWSDGYPGETTCALSNFETFLQATSIAPSFAALPAPALPS